MSRTLTWLHLSDLHARKRDGWDIDLVVQPLLADLQRMQQKHGLRPDFIFFTGDVAFGEIPGNSLAEQYKLAWERFFLPILNAYDPPIPRERLFVVPGNHDVHRALAEMPTEWLRNPKRSFPNDIQHLISGDPKSQRWQDVIRRLDAYRAFLHQYLPHLTPDDPHLLWTCREEIHDVPVGIVGFNTAWSCADDEDKDKLWFGADWQRGEAKKRLALDSPALTFALFHHPANWFDKQEGDEPMGRLGNDFHISLHGHEHKPRPHHNGNNHHLTVRATGQQTEARRRAPTRR